MTVATIQKYSKYSQPKLIEIAVRWFNAYIRQRDAGDGTAKCISCPAIVSLDNCHASHFRASTYSSTRFDERNVHVSCVKCNTHLHGNLIDYRINLVKKIGLAEVEDIERKSRMSFKWDRFYLIDIIETYKAKLKQAA